MDTLPDYLATGLEIVFVGTNPGAYSAETGHYYAHPRNRFWGAVNKSGLLDEPLDATRDHLVLEQKVGLTDLVKKPTVSASKLRASDYRGESSTFKQKLFRFKPIIVCFHGVTAYGNYLRYGEGTSENPKLGLQTRRIGDTVVFVVPNLSPANASYQLCALIEWYQKLSKLRDRMRSL